MQGIGVFIVCIFVIGIVEFILNALFKKGSEDRQFVMMLFNPKFLAKGGWVIWLCLGLWAWLFFLI